MNNLIKQGENNMALAKENMGALMEIKKRFEKEKPLKGVRIGMALHITKETANLVETLEAGGAEVAVAGCNPLSTQDDVAEALRAKGVKAYGKKGQTSEEYYACLNSVLDLKPHITIDDGCDLVTEIHTKHTDLLTEIIGGCEETTTGIIRLHSMVREGALKYPVIAVNDNKTKHLMDNYYGTGQSTWDGILRATNTLICGKTVVIAGYGSCGKGCAMRAKGMGANVIVTEVDAFPALQAKMDGFRVMKMEDAAPIGDIFITVTGNKHVIRPEHIKVMRMGAILANSGHFDIEIDVKGIREIAKRTEQVRPFMEKFEIDGPGYVYILGEGRLINLAAAEGHPSDVMSMSFCGQALACEFLVKNKGKLKAEVIQLPEEIDDEIAKLQLKTMNVEIDKLTPEQIEYLNSWQEGTS
jgi:adenosylhomocysteinase